MIVETERCQIRKFRAEDIAAFMNYHNDLEWMKYQGFKGRTLAEYRQALLVPAFDLTTGQQLAIIDRQKQNLIGDLYVRQVGTTFWLGYTIAPQFARQGYATEAISGIINWLLTNKQAQVIRAEVELGNISSQRLLEKLGFHYLETTDQLLNYALNLNEEV